jgi:hypothetical protein
MLLLESRKRCSPSDSSGTTLTAQENFPTHGKLKCYLENVFMEDAHAYLHLQTNVTFKKFTAESRTYWKSIIIIFLSLLFNAVINLFAFMTFSGKWWSFNVEHNYFLFGKFFLLLMYGDSRKFLIDMQLQGNDIIIIGLGGFNVIRKFFELGSWGLQIDKNYELKFY